MRSVLATIQEECVPWADHNFGRVIDPLRPLAGMMEELGELAEAVIREDQDEIKDALSDLVIFACQFAARANVPLPASTSERPVNREDPMLRMIIALGRVAHACLKKAEGIRSHEDHDETMRIGLQDLLYAADSRAARRGFDLESEALKTWERVKQRDWKADPETAHEQGGVS